jgi:lysyl-tRNA synthetase class 2
MSSSASGDWRPSASLEALKLRARMLDRIRAFFASRGVLEVETPILSSGASTDPNLASLATRYDGPGGMRTLYLHTSPEFAMKRLLAAGCGSIYQLCKVFRDGEAGRLHNPEFTMLEWYRIGFDHHRLMDEVAALVIETLAGALTLGETEKISYREAFERHAGLDPHTAGIDAFAQRARALTIQAPAALDVDGWRDLLLTHAVEPHLGRGRLTFLYDYPASQAALARVRTGHPPLASRFELYLEGIELANGFHELGDSSEQRRRFEQDLARRQNLELPAVPADERLVEALEHGLPECAGVALGVDRLVMIALGERALEAALAFPLGRA